MNNRPHGASLAAVAMFGAAVAAAFTVLAALSGIERFVVGIGIAVISLICVAVTFRAFARRERTWVLGAAAIFIAAGAGLGWSGWSEHRDSNAKHAIVREEAAVASTIQGAGNAEASWYEHPKQHRLADLERYYLPVSAGGVAITEVTDAVKKFNRERCRWASSEHHLIDIRSITVDGNHAVVHSVESYHQPRVCSGPPPATSAKIDDVWKNTYDLRKTKSGWRIVSDSVIYL